MRQYIRNMSAYTTDQSSLRALETLCVVDTSTVICDLQSLLCNSPPSRLTILVIFAAKCSTDQFTCGQGSPRFCYPGVVDAQLAATDVGDLARRACQVSRSERFDDLLALICFSIHIAVPIP